MYRPQNVFPVAVDPCEDFRCTYSFDYSNVPMLAAGVPTTFSNTTRIPLNLDRDADFFIRGIQVSPTLLEIGLTDPWNNPLVDPGQGMGFDNDGLPPYMRSYVWAQTCGAGLVILDGDNWGIYCRAGSVLGLYVNNDTGAAQDSPVITIHGIKRYRKGACR